MLAYSDRVTPEQLAAECAAAGAAIMGEAPRWAPHANAPNPERKLRVGYVSPDLRNHSVAYFIEGLLEHHDRSQFELVCYDTAAVPDAVTARLKSHVEKWIECPRLDSETLGARIRADQIDILVELSGYSSGHRMSLMARKPAPVQVSYLGWATTTGVPTIDYRLVDGGTDPAGFERLSSERLVRLDPCFLAYRPAADAPAVADRTPGSGFVFASFNTVQKVTPTTVALWASAMKAVPGSRLLLKSLGLAAARAQQRITEMLTAEGVDATRVEMLPQTKGMKEHLETYARVDVALDTAPYNGTTTTCESLWMGVPVVVMEGDRHSARVGATLLRAAGLAELVATDRAQWLAIVTGLANDEPRRGTLRRGLREKLRASPLCDGVAHARRVESAYRRMWRDWCGFRTGGRG